MCPKVSVELEIRSRDILVSGILERADDVAVVGGRADLCTDLGRCRQSPGDPGHEMGAIALLRAVCIEAVTINRPKTPASVLAGAERHAWEKSGKGCLG